MAEQQWDEMFARFEADAAATFAPVPLPELARRARRRNLVHRSVLAAVLVALLAGPTGAYALATDHGPNRPPVLPNPTASVAPSVSPSVSPTEVRRIAVAGVDLPLRGVWFVQDSRHAFAMFESCSASNPCRYALGATADGGRTWHRLGFPDLSRYPQAAVNFYPLSPQVLTVHVVGIGFWLSTDGGAHYSRYAADKPPTQALLAATARIPGDAYTLLCPGAKGFEDGASGIECDREQLVRIGSGPVSPQPTLPGKLLEVTTGGDGRIWLVADDNGRYRVAYSTDHAKTWHELATPADHGPSITVSPDGSEVWLVDDFPARLWRLTGDTFVAQSGLPADAVGFGVQALGGGVLMFGANHGSAGLWQSGTVTLLDKVQGVQGLPDGTAVFVDATSESQDNTGYLVLTPPYTTSFRLVP